MKTLRPTPRGAALPLALAALALAGGCSSNCTATAAKLDTLRRGMTSQEVAGVMGCPGTPWPRDDNSGVTTLQWNGPDGLLSVVDADFQNDRLLYYGTRTRGAW